MTSSARVRGAGATAAVVALSLLSGCALIPSGVGAQPQVSPPPATTQAPPRPAVDVPVVSADPPEVVSVASPSTVSIPDVAVQVPVVPVGVLPDGFMELHPDPAVGGWYRFGSAPASEGGNTVIAAHVDQPDYPIGPFSRLRDLGVGAAIDVTDAEGTVWTYRVDSVTNYVKEDLPDDLFARAGERRLVLITCGGPYDYEQGRYRDNVVVVAAMDAASAG